jgi:hypothetical protein
MTVERQPRSMLRSMLSPILMLMLRATVMLIEVFVSVAIVDRKDSMGMVIRIKMVIRIRTTKRMMRTDWTMKMRTMMSLTMRTERME